VRLKESLVVSGTIAGSVIVALALLSLYAIVYAAVKEPRKRI
jgi:hypothetical protein